MKRLSVMLYSVVNYAFGVAALVYLIAFLFNFYVPKTIDSGEPGNVAVAVAVDVGLIFLFALQHSVMARPRFKAWLTGFVPHAAERSTFMLATALVTFALCLLWQPLPQVIWRAPDGSFRRLPQKATPSMSERVAGHPLPEQARLQQLPPVLPRRDERHFGSGSPSDPWPERGRRHIPGKSANRFPHPVPPVS